MKSVQTVSFIALGVMLGVTAVDLLTGSESTIWRFVWQLI